MLGPIKSGFNTQTNTPTKGGTTVKKTMSPIQGTWSIKTILS